MKNLLTLHEAVAVILVNEPDKTATFQRISYRIEKRKLFPNRKGGITLAEQIRLRTAISSSRYKTLFEFIEPDRLRLK